MKYIIPFETLKQSIPFAPKNGQSETSRHYDNFLAVMRKLLMGISVDEKWYRETYPDVAQAIDAGLYMSARHHFSENGYFEGRRPFAFVVDEAWYIETYPDVKDGIDSGELRSAMDHYEKHGFQEGRLPGPV